MPVVESIVLAVSGWMLSPPLARGSNKLLDSLGNNVEKDRQELIVIALPLLKLKIEKMEASEHPSMSEEFLQRAKDVYDDAEDTVDLHKYSQLHCDVASSKNRAIILVHNLFRSLHTVLRDSRCVMPVLKHSQDRRKIKLRKRLNKVKKITNEVEEFCSRVQPDRRAAVTDNRQTISLPPQKVFGRDEDRDEIIRRLSAASTGDPGSTSIPVIAIVGRPGVGKTTTAQYVCQMLRTEKLSNHLVLWVYASCSFQPSEIMKNIILQTSNPNENSFNVSMINSLEVLHKEMGKKLNGNKFFLVIDDVWYDVEDQQQTEYWEILFRCFTEYYSPGSKILVTSQTKDAPRKIVAARGATLEYTHYLKELEENDFSDLFMHHTRLSGEIDSSLRKDFEEECKTIAKKLNKDPTAAEIVGKKIDLNLADLLRSQGNWRTYLRTIAEDLSGDKTKALMWSYQYLPANLRRCFSLLSLYPSGHKFKDLELVQLWMAQEFIKLEKKDEKDAGNGYIDELVSKFNGYIDKLVSKFYIQRRVHSSFGTVYMLHELFWDLAEKVSCNDCFTIKDNHKSEIPPTIRHLSIPAYKLDEYKEKICKLKRLRTLIITRRGSDTSEESVATDVFKNWKNLRVLISEVNLENLAEFISEMKLLRILQVPGTSEFVLPELVCTLHLLQVLKIESARSLPKNLKNLASLMYLENFPVRKEKGCDLEQLQDLNQLRGRLCIGNLENVESKESAIAANLKKKEHLDTLKLVWQAGGDNVDCNLHAEVLEGLNFPPNLTSLHLDGYGGRLWPSWLKSQTSDIQDPHSLQFLSLKNCSNLSNPPEGTNLARSLINISIQGCPILEQSIYDDPVSGKRMFGGIPVQTASTQSQ